MADRAHVVLKEGFLKKRSRSNALVTNWRRRYFRLYAGELHYYLSPQDPVERRRMILRLDTTVTQNNDQGYPFCFVVKASPTEENFYLQAESEQEKAEWATAIFDAARRTADVAAQPPAAAAAQPSVSATPAPPKPPARVLLQLNVVEARELLSADLNGKSDPYCVVNLIGKNGELIRTEEHKTAYVTDTLEPIWNQHFTIGNAVDLRTVEAIHFELWDHDHVTRNSSLGFVKVPLSIFQMSPASTAHSELVDRWFRIEPPVATTVVPSAMSAAIAYATGGSSSPRREKEEKEAMIKHHGELHVVMSIAGPNLVDFFQSVHVSVGPQSRIVTDGVEHTDNRLEVQVLAARDLISADFNQSSDPFVELQLLDDNGKAIRGESYTTSVKYKTRNPAWENEHHVFGRICRIDQAAKLRIRVMDWDKHSKNDPLGGVVLELDHLSAHNQTEWYPLQPEPGMAIRENLGAIHVSIALIGETRGERRRRLKIHKEVTAKTHEQSVEQLELENAQHMLHDAACKLDGARIACAVEDYQSRHPQFYGINGCIHHLNTQIPRAHRDTTSSDESFQSRSGVEGQAQLEVSVIGTRELPKADTLVASNPYAVIEMDPPVCIEECRRTSAPLSPQRSKRVEALNSAASEARNAMFSKRTQAEVSSHRAKLGKNEVRSERRLDTSPDRPVLKVEVKSGHGLSGVDLGGYSDPYCTLTLTDHATGKPVEVEKKRTAVISKTLNPVWQNETFYFGNNFPLSDAGMLLIHVKDHNNIGRSTPLGRVQIPLSDLCHASATSTSIASTAQEKRYPLAPEPWMKKHADNLGELCIKTEVIGDATLLANMLQRSHAGAPDKLLSFLFMSSFSSDPYMSDTSAVGGPSSLNVGALSEHEGEVTEIIEKGKPIRTSTVVGAAAKWRKEKFTMSLSYAGMFSDTKPEKKDRFTLHLRILGARNLLGPHRTAESSKAAGDRLPPPHPHGLQSKQGHGTNAYFTVIPVLGNGQLDHTERKQSLTVYGTRHPNWPEQEFVFGKLKDIAGISYLSLHVYTRDLAGEQKRPLRQLLNADETKQTVRLRRSQVHKLAPSGEVDDDGIEILGFDQRVLAFRACADGGRFYPARVQKYLPFPEDVYELLFEDGVETINDVWNLFSLDIKGKIEAIHADGSVDVSVLPEGDELNSDAAARCYAKNIPLSRLTPVDAFTGPVQRVLARRLDPRKEEWRRWEQLRHPFSGLQVEILSVSDLPKDVTRPGCIVTLLGNPTAAASWAGRSLVLGPHGELVTKKPLLDPQWAAVKDVIELAVPFDSAHPDVASLLRFEERPLVLGDIGQDTTSPECDTELIAEGVELVTHLASLMIRIVDQGSDPMPMTKHRTIGFVRIDLTTLRDGDHELNPRILPAEHVPYYKFMGSMFVNVKCVDSSHKKDDTAQFKAAVKASGAQGTTTTSATAATTTTTTASTTMADGSRVAVGKPSAVCGAAKWFKDRMLQELQAPALSPAAALSGISLRDTVTRITRRQNLRASLTPTENAQVDAFHTVLVVIMKRVVAILREIQLFEQFELLPKDEMATFRHVHTINADAMSEHLGRHINELKVETRKDIVVHLEMELLDIAASDLPRVYPPPELPREEWIQLRGVRQKELQRLGGGFMQDRPGVLGLVTLPWAFTGEGMISWILRAPGLLWKDQWTKYCHDAQVKESCKLRWEDPKLDLDHDAMQAPRTREQALLWLSTLGDAGYVENVSPSLSTGDAHKKYYLVEDRADRYYRLREVEMWAAKAKRDKSLFPLDLVQEVDCYQQVLAELAPPTAPVAPPSPPPSPKKFTLPSVSPSKASAQQQQQQQAPAAPTTVSTEDLLALRQKTYAKKLTEHVEGFLGTQNAISSVLFSREVQQNALLRPVAAKTQQLVAAEVLWDWKYCLFIPAHRCIYMYERDTSLAPTVIIDMNSGICHSAYNFAYDTKGGWFDVVNATVLHRQYNEHGEAKYAPLSDELRDKWMKTRPDGAQVLEFKSSESQLWVQAFVRAGVRVDMKPGQLVVLKRLNPTVLQQKCIHYVTDFDPTDLDGSFQRLLNRFYAHDVESSHHEHEQKLRELRATIRSEVKRSGKVGETVMAYYGKGQRLNPRPTNERMYTRGALYSGRVVRIRTPYTDAKYRFTQTYEPNEAPPAMVALLAKYKVTDKAAWLRLPKTLRDLFLLYDVEYRHAHEVIIEEGLLREHVRTNDGDLDPTKVAERCTDLNLLFKASDLEDCVTRMVLHTGGRKPLGCLKIPIKTVSPHRLLDVWYPLAPENEMIQKANLGHLRVQLRLVQVNQMTRSKHVPAILMADTKEALSRLTPQQQLQSQSQYQLQAPSSPLSNPLKFLKDRVSNRSSRRGLSPAATTFAPSRERSFIKLNILEGRKLIAADFLTSDPFVKIVLVHEKDDREEFTKLKTDIKSKTLSPKWQNQEFVLGKTEATMLSDKKAIILRVMDHDLTSADDPMGHLRLELQRDKTGTINGLVLIHGDDKGHATSRILHLDEHNRIEVDERLLADEKAGQSRGASARGNNAVHDGKLGRLRFVVEVQQNDNYVDPNAMNSTKIASILKSLETKFSLEITLKKATVGGKAAASLGAADWRQYGCVFIPQGEGGQRVHYDVHTEDLGAGNKLRLGDLLSGAAPTKVLGRTFDMSRVACFDVKVRSETSGREFVGRFGEQRQFRNPEAAAAFTDEVIVLRDRANKDLELHVTLDARVIAIHRAERLKRLLAETFRLVGLQFDPRGVNEAEATGPSSLGTRAGATDVPTFLWEVCKAHHFPGRQLPQELLAQVQRMGQSAKLHWRYTPQLLGLLLEHVFAFGERDRLTYHEAVAVDALLSRWSRVLHHVTEAKTQLIGHLHGKETPRLIHTLLSECDWTGFEFASLPELGAGRPPTTESGSDPEGSPSSHTESLFRPGHKVHALLPPRKHTGVAVDVRLVSGQFVAGTITAEYGDQSYDVAFCTSAKVREDGDEYFSDDDELPPLPNGQVVFVCPIAHAATVNVLGEDETEAAAPQRLTPGRSGIVTKHDDVDHPKAPYLVTFDDKAEPKEQWVARVCLDSKFRNVAGSELFPQLHRDDFVRVLAAGSDGGASGGGGGGGTTRPARVTKNHRNARYDIAYLDGQAPVSEAHVPRDRLQPVSDKSIYEAEVREVYLEAVSGAGGKYAVQYDLALKNGDVVRGIGRELLRAQADAFPSDRAVLAALFFSELSVVDVDNLKGAHGEMAQRLHELWAYDELIKVYVMLESPPTAIHLRDGVSNRLLQAKLVERDEARPRFVDQCHGFVRGERFSDVEVAKLAQIFETAAVLEGNTAVLQDPDAFDPRNCFCLYMAPQARVEIHGSLRLAPGKTAPSQGVFKALLGLALSDEAKFLGLLQRLLRSTASEHMPLNRKERIVAMKGVQVCFYRKPARNIALNSLTSTCDGEVLGDDGKTTIAMSRIALQHLSLCVAFQIAVPHNNRGSLADALTVAHVDASSILERLVDVGGLQLLGGARGLLGGEDKLLEGVWTFTTGGDSGPGDSVLLEVGDAEGKKGSRPSVTLELLPLDDQRLSVEDASGRTYELCLPMDKILVEAQLRRHLVPHHEAKVVGGPHFVGTEHAQQQQVSKKSRRDSLLLSRPTAPLKPRHSCGSDVPPAFDVEFRDSKSRPAQVSQHDLKFDTLHVRVLHASQLVLKDSMGSGDVVVEILLQSSDFERQLEGDLGLRSPFGLVLSATGEICKDAKGRAFPSTAQLSKQPNAVEWTAGREAPPLSFGFPSMDVGRVAGINVKLWARGTQKLIGSTFIPLSEIAETFGHRNAEEAYDAALGNGGGPTTSSRASTSPTSAAGRRSRRFPFIPTGSGSARRANVSAVEQTFSVYRTEHDHRHVVGKIKLQMERTHRIQPGDVVLARRFQEEQDAWAISGYELLATTMRMQKDQLLRGLLATNAIGGGQRIVKDPVEQELQLQRIAQVMMISHAMELIYATRPAPKGGGQGPQHELRLRDGTAVGAPGVLDQLKHALTQTKWLIEDTAAEFGIRTTGKRLPWSSDPGDDEAAAAAQRAQLVVVRANASNTSVRVRRTVLKLYHMYRNRLIPTLQRLYELDRMGDGIDVKAGEQLLAFFEEEVEDLDPQDQHVYRRVYQRLRMLKIAQVLHEIMQTTLRVTIMDQDPDIGDDQIGTAYIPILDLLDQVEHDNFYELTKTRRTAAGGLGASGATATTTVTTIKQGKVHLRLLLTYSESSLLEQATNVYKFLKNKYIVQHETARRRINAAVVPAQRRRWMTIKGYLDELRGQSTGKLHWERTPVLLNLVWDIFLTPKSPTKGSGNAPKDDDEKLHLQGLAEKADEYRACVVQVHSRWANLQPKLEELLQIQAATQIHAQRTPQLLDEIEREVEGLDLVLSTAWQQVYQKWMVLFNALEELAGMQERNKLHLARAPQLLNLVTQRCSRGLNERHAEAVSNVQFRWMAITQRDGPLCELRLMDKKGLHWRRTHELVLLLNEQCEGFAEIDAKALDAVQKRWEQVQEWLDDVVQMQIQHSIDCEATPFILKKMHLLESKRGQRKPTAHTDKRSLHSPRAGGERPGGGTPGAATSPRQGKANAIGAEGVVSAAEIDVGRLEGLAEWYAIEEAKRELERIPHHRITTDHDRSNWLPYSQDGKDTRLIISQEEMAFSAANVRIALVDRGVIPQFSSFDGSTASLLPVGSPRSPTKGTARGATSTTLPKDLLDEIYELEQAIESAPGDGAQRTLVQWNPERVAELYTVIEGLGKSDLLWKIEHVVNANRELEIPDHFLRFLDEMRMRQIPTTEIEDLVRTLTVTLQKEELHKAGVDVPPNANFTAVLALMHRHNVRDVQLPVETSLIQTLLQDRGMDKKGEPVFLRGMRIGTQSWSAEAEGPSIGGGAATATAATTTAGGGKPGTGPKAATINTGLGIIDTQVELLRKSLLLEALRKRNSLIKTFPGETQILSQEELSECTEVDMSGDYMTLIERFQHLLIHESYTRRLAEYAAMDRCMRALLRAPRDQVVTKEDIALALQTLGTRFRLPLEAFTREELLEAAREGKIRTPTEAMLARCPRGRNAKAMAHYAAVSHAAMVFEETTSFRARLDPVTQGFVDALPFEAPSSVEGLSVPKTTRSRMNLKQVVVDWLLGTEESVVRIQRQLGAYHRQRLHWATAAFTLRNRWFHRGHGWCDDAAKGAGVKVLLQRLLIFENANKMHMVATEALLNEVNDKCVNLRARERQAKEALEQRFYANLEMLERLVGHAEKCINNRKLHTEETPALLHAIEQTCVVPQGLNARHREAYHVVTSHWIPHRARLAELVQMHKEGTFSIHRTPELLSAMEFHTEGEAGADELNLERVMAVAGASSTPVEVQQQFVERKVDEIRRGQRKQSSTLRLNLDAPNTETDAVLEEMQATTEDNNQQWQSLSPSKRHLQPLSPHDKQTSWKVASPTTGAGGATLPHGGGSAVVLETKHVGGPENKRRKSSIGDELKEILRSPSKWLMAGTEPPARIRPEQFYPQVVAHDAGGQENSASSSSTASASATL